MSEVKNLRKNDTSPFSSPLRVDDEISWQKFARMFLRSVIPWCELFNPSRVFVCWDKGRCPYRVALNPEYKLNRVKQAPTADEILSDANYALARDWLHGAIPAIGITSVLHPGIEADDLAYFITSRHENVVLISDDNDWHLNIHPGSRLFRPMKKIQNKPENEYLITYEEFHRRINEGEIIKVDPRRHFLLTKVFCGDKGEIPPITTPKKAEKIVDFMTGRAKTLDQSLLTLMKDNTSNVVRNLQLANTDWLVSRPEVGDGDSIISTALQNTSFESAKNFHKIANEVGLLNYYSRWHPIFSSLMKDT